MVALHCMLKDESLLGEKADSKMIRAVCRLRDQSPLLWKVDSTSELGQTLDAGHLQVFHSIIRLLFFKVLKHCIKTGRVHAFGPDAMIHRVSLEASANGAVEVIYSNSWIQPARQKACGPSGGAGDLLSGGLALPRMLVLAAMARLVGVELPTTERTGAGATSVVHQAMNKKKENMVF